MKLLLIIILVISVGCETKSEIKITADDNTKQPTNPNGSGGESSGGESSGGESSGGESSGGESSGESSTPSVLDTSDFSDPNPSDSDIHNFVAFSVRKVVTGYSGPFFKAKRSDGVTADFGAGVDTVDTVALQAWMDEGDGTAKIMTWYDQSGNSEHAHQLTDSLMPSLISNCSTGADPYPCLNFVDDALVFNDSSSSADLRINNSTGMAMFLTIKYNVTGDQMILGDSSVNYELLHYGSTIHAYANFATVTQNTSNFQTLSILEDNSNTGYFYNNGLFVNTSSSMWSVSNSYGDTSKTSTLGKFFSSTRRIINYKITEFILINSEISREDTSENKHGEISDDIKNFYGL